MPRNTSGLRRGGPGRPPGVPNKATIEAKQVCSELVDNPDYRERLKARLIAGKLPPAVETMLWYYAKGKPKEVLEVEDRRQKLIKVVLANKPTPIDKPATVKDRRRLAGEAGM